MATLTYLLSLALLTTLIPAQPEPAPAPPRLVHASDAVFVHALGGFAIPERNLERVEQPGLMLLHTQRGDGRMTALLGPTGTISMPTRRQSFHGSRIAGVLVHEERICVVVWRARAWDRVPEAGEAWESPQWNLEMFRIADGARLPSPALPPAPEIAPEETVEAGVLKAVAGGIAIGETTIRFEAADKRD